jgi:hypothetical protein
MGYEDSLNLYQAFNQNPVNFVDPFGKQHWIIEEELMQEGALKEHLIKRYGNLKGELEFNQIIGSKRRIERTMAASFYLASGGMLLAPHLSGPALLSILGSISTYSAIDSYSKRKQAGQTEREARRGAFGAATGFNFLFNLMGYDYGTLGSVSQEEIENSWATLIGGGLGISLGKNINSFNETSVRIVKFNAKAKRFYDAETGQFIKFDDVPWPLRREGFIKIKITETKPGQILDRYGSEFGIYLAPEGTLYEMRGIAQGYVEYHKYEVIKPFPVKAGYTAPVEEFNSIGYGYQYKTYKRVKKLVEEGYLREIE